MSRMYGLIALFFMSSAVLASDLAVEMGTGVRWEQKSGENAVDHQGLLGLALTYDLDPIEITGELTHFSATSVEPAVRIERSHYELMSWVGYRAFSSDKSQVLFSGGMGFFWENTRTELGSLTSLGSSGAEFLVGAAATYRYSFDANWGLNLRFAAILNTNNSLAPVADTLLRVSYKF